MIIYIHMKTLAKIEITCRLRLRTNGSEERVIYNAQQTIENICKHCCVSVYYICIKHTHTHSHASSLLDAFECDSYTHIEKCSVNCVKIWRTNNFEKEKERECERYRYDISLCWTVVEEQRDHLKVVHEHIQNHQIICTERKKKTTTK